VSAPPRRSSIKANGDLVRPTNPALAKGKDLGDCRP
jgi:hypothetical protein